MAESSITSWKDKWMSLRKRHHSHIERAGEGAQMIGQAIISSVASGASGVIDQKWGPAEAAYPNLGMAKLGPLPASLALGAAGLGLALYGHGKQWAPWAEAAGIGASNAYSYAQGRRMTLDWMKKGK